MKSLDKLLKQTRLLAKSPVKQDSILLNQGRILAKLNQQGGYTRFCDSEFKVFSQYGEDGIIQFLVNNLDIQSRTFIEFGVETFEESNCRFLMMKDLWSGFVVDGSRKNIEVLKQSYFFWQYPLNAVCEFIDKDSIGSILDRSGFGVTPGILSIDIDGVDYHIYKELRNYNPEILIVEYNSHFGSELPLSVPYSPDFVRKKAHWSNQYWGASLSAFADLANQRNMALVGVTSTGQNAFFVQRHLLNDMVVERSVEDCFRKMSFRDSRDEAGQLTFLSAHQSVKLMKDLPLENTVSGEVKSIAEFLG